MKFGKGVGPKFTELLLFFLGKPSCIRNPRKSQALLVFLNLFQCRWELQQSYAERLDLLADIQQERARLRVAVLHMDSSESHSQCLLFCIMHLNVHFGAILCIALPQLHCKPNWLFGSYGDGDHSLAFILDDSDCLSLHIQVNCTCCQKSKSTLKKSTR